MTPSASQLDPQPIERACDPPAAALTLASVDFGYQPGEPVIRSVSASLRPGRLTTLIGPNASGKTTLLKLMLGQLEPWAGAINLGSDPIDQLAPRARAQRLSYVPQRSAVRFAFTVEQVVRMARYRIGRDDQAVDHAIDACDLSAHRSKVFLTLSAGQQQGVLLARAIAQARGRGLVMLLDEPVSAMDLKHQHATMRRLCDLASAGLAVLVVLHDLNLAARYAHDAWLMNRGRLVAAGAWDCVLTPETLEPVYEVRIRRLTRDGSDRPALLIDSEPTLSAEGMIA